MIKKTKYKNKKVEHDGIMFDSKDEMLYYQFLQGRLAEGKIKCFSIQPKYILIPKFEYFGQKRRETTYTPDFLVEYENGDKIAIDIKGFSTQQGDLRRKLYEHENQNIKLIWITRNIKYGDEYGWIDYDLLKKLRSKAKKEKQQEC